MIAIFMELLGLNLIIELVKRLFGLALALVVTIGLVWGVCTTTDGEIQVPFLGNICRVVQVFPTDGGDAGEPGCPQFAGAFPQLLPDTWALRHVESINIDRDTEQECLAMYQYDVGNGPYGGPLGGVIYDPQPDRDPSNLSATIPYRPASYIPYHLLPREDGKGFLSERTARQADWSDMIQVYDADDEDGQELVIQGYSGYNFPTYLSIFKWENKVEGYRLMTGRLPEEDRAIGGPLWGNAGIEIEREQVADEEGNVIYGEIEQVVVKTRPSQPFWYFRSQLCHARLYEWNDQADVLEYQDDYYLTFCFGRPNNVLTREDQYFLWYPEEALLAWYEEGEIKEIGLPASPVGNVLQATVTLRQDSRQRWQLTQVWQQDWDLEERSDEVVANMTYWELERIGEPYDP